MSVLVHVSVCVHVMYMCATACVADAVSHCCRRHHARAMPSTPAQESAASAAPGIESCAWGQPTVPTGQDSGFHITEPPVPWQAGPQNITQDVLSLPSTQETQRPL